MQITNSSWIRAISLRCLPTTLLTAMALLLPLAALAAQPAAHPRKAAPKTALKSKTSNAAPKTAPEPPPPPAPELPRWPANEKPTRAAISWDSHGLRIEATNASLQQILKEISTLTGTQIDGFSGDERVFGTFGPGLAREVLSQLLHGTGYNVLMVGDQGQGAPRQIVLTSPKSGAARSTATRGAKSDDDDDDDASATEDDPAPPAFNAPQPPNGAPRSPQQIMEDLRQRQQIEGGAPPNGPAPY